MNGFAFPADLTDDTIDQIIDGAAVSFAALTAPERGALVCDRFDGALIGLLAAHHLLDTGTVDRVVVVTPVERTLFWTGLAETCTGAPTVCYHGARRHDLLTDQPVVVSTPETLHGELMVRQQQPGRRSQGSWQPGPSFPRFTGPNLWIFDELVRLTTRASESHRFWAAALDRMDHPHVLALTSQEPTGEALYNLGRLLLPTRMPSVADFEDQYCSGRTRLTFRADRAPVLRKLFGAALVTEHERSPKDLYALLERSRRPTAHAG